MKLANAAFSPTFPLFSNCLYIPSPSISPKPPPSHIPLDINTDVVENQNNVDSARKQADSDNSVRPDGSVELPETPKPPSVPVAPVSAVYQKLRCFISGIGVQPTVHIPHCYSTPDSEFCQYVREVDYSLAVREVATQFTAFHAEQSKDSGSVPRPLTHQREDLTMWMERAETTSVTLFKLLVHGFSRDFLVEEVWECCLSESLLDSLVVMEREKEVSPDQMGLGEDSSSEMVVEEEDTASTFSEVLPSRVSDVFALQSQHQQRKHDNKRVKKIVKSQEVAPHQSSVLPPISVYDVAIDQLVEKFVQKVVSKFAAGDRPLPASTIGAYIGHPDTFKKLPKVLQHVDKHKLTADVLSALERDPRVAVEGKVIRLTQSHIAPKVVEQSTASLAAASTRLLQALTAKQQQQEQKYTPLKKESRVVTRTASPDPAAQHRAAVQEVCDQLVTYVVR
eukprot:gene35470-43734_t